MGFEGHRANIKVSHLLYMDDFNLIGKTEDELQKQMQVVEPSVIICIWNWT
jgi:hypothetical protein